MKPIKEMKQPELAAYVQSSLRQHGINSVLTGGALVSLYASGKYVSLDIDLILALLKELSQVKDIMRTMGFTKPGRHYQHPDTQFLIEFPKGPLSFGGDGDIDTVAIETVVGLLNALSPTDCVKDRLSHYYFWEDQQGLLQARLVAANHEIDLEAIENWSRSIDKGEAFDRIRESLQQLD